MEMKEAWKQHRNQEIQELAKQIVKAMKMTARNVLWMTALIMAMICLFRGMSIEALTCVWIMFALDLVAVERQVRELRDEKRNDETQIAAFLAQIQAAKKKEGETE